MKHIVLTLTKNSLDYTVDGAPFKAPILPIASSCTQSILYNDEYNRNRVMRELLVWVYEEGSIKAGLALGVLGEPGGLLRALSCFK